MTLFHNAPVVITGDADGIARHMCSKCNKLCNPILVGIRITPKPRPAKHAALVDDPRDNLNAGLKPAAERPSLNRAIRRVESLESFIRSNFGECYDCAEKIYGVDEIIENWDDEGYPLCAKCAKGRDANASQEFWEEHRE